jgi:hypothetical protein
MRAKPPSRQGVYSLRLCVLEIKVIKISGADFAD